MLTRLIPRICNVSVRPLSLSASVQNAKSSIEELVEEKWIKRMQGKDTIRENHSSLLANQDKVYEIQFHRAKSGLMHQYLEEYEDYVTLVREKVPTAHLEGSFQVVVGNQDEAVHVWRFDDAYKGTDKLIRAQHSDRTLSRKVTSLSTLCKKRQNVFVRSFFYWRNPEPKPSSHIYEIRKYLLKPGQMIEWGKHWSTGVNQLYNHGFGGFFTQVGPLFTVYHIWAYESMDERKEIREDMWSKPGWDETVTKSVAVTNQLDSIIMLPNEFSPTQ